MNAKAIINLKEGTIDLEGSEEIVSKYLDIFKEKISFSVSKSEIGELNRRTPKTMRESQPKDEEKTRKPRTAPKVDIEKFNIDGDKAKGVPALEDFMKAIDSEKLKSSHEFILAVSYYVTKVVKSIDFSDGNIEYAYKVLDTSNRPVHLRQIITNLKNKNSWFEPSDTDNKRWKLTRIGEIYYEKNLKS